MTNLLSWTGKIKPTTFFVVCATVFGLIFILLTPPFQTPDEFNHFYRAYQISEGQFIALQPDQRLGGELPASLMKLSEPFRAMPLKDYVSTNYATIVAQFAIPLKPKEKIFIDFPNTGLYSPVSYFPQAVSIFVLRLFELPPLYIFYGARIGTLLFWVFGIFLTLQLLPFYQWFFVLLALLPMSVFTNMSLSADVVTNLLSFLLMAYSLKLAYEEQVVLTRHILVFAILCMLLALAKVVYIPLMLLFFIIPKKKFANSKIYFLQLSFLCLISFCTALCWSLVIADLYIPYSLYNPAFREGPIMETCIVYCANMQEQLHYIFSQGLLYLPEVFLHSMTTAFDMYAEGYIGTFGWLDTYIPLRFVYTAYVVIFFVAVFGGEKSVALKWSNKLILVIVLIASLSLLLLSQLLTWSCVGTGLVRLIQGRYVIPLFPLLWMLLYNRTWLYPRSVTFLVTVFSVWSLSYSSVLLYKRYYTKHEVKLIHVSCGAEKVTKDNYYNTDNPSIVFENGNTQSKEHARSGFYSAKISKSNPYAFTYMLSGCGWSDSIKVDVWRYGKHGTLVITDVDDEFSSLSSEPIETDSLGWDHLQVNFFVPFFVKEEGLKIFMYNEDENDSSYFDELRITHRKIR
ncbi:MAG: Protein of unknown function rane [Chitinophagaceae bacterium]|nr:Protein of unknown function rane [Chitinophagaceae bacterium]